MPSLRFDSSQRSAVNGPFQQPLTQRPNPVFVAGSTEHSLLHSLSTNRLSVIIPARNEAASLPQLVKEIVQACRTMCENVKASVTIQLDSFEIIIVDDGSTDSTPCVLQVLAQLYPELSYLRLQAHAGQSAALTAGIYHAAGNWLATLDADLQNDPGDLATLWAALPGNEVVLGWRVQRQDSWSRRLTSYLANKIRNIVLGQAIHDTGCSLRVFPRLHALQLPLFEGVHRFLGPLLLRQGCRVVQVPVSHRRRLHGRSHYNLWNRSIRVVVDLFGVAWLMRRPIYQEEYELAMLRNVSTSGEAFYRLGRPTARQDGVLE
jgi:glycosyltransferase involved in cell wall biosynthesis